MEYSTINIQCPGSTGSTKMNIEDESWSLNIAPGLQITGSNISGKNIQQSMFNAQCSV
jgi:hypothetical protein